MNNFAKAKAKANKQKVATPDKKVMDLSAFMIGDKTGQEVVDQQPERLIELDASEFYVDEQVRKTFEPEELHELAASMTSNGQIQPIVVYPKDEQGYKIDKGERRWRAAQLIDGFKLMALIDEDAPKRNKRKRIVGQIVENDQRNDLRPYEMATALEDLKADGMTMQEIAIELGWLTQSNKPRINKVSRILSILKLPEEGQRLAKERIVTDYISLELLRKIYDISPNVFTALCKIARQEDGLTRSRLEAEYKQCRDNFEQQGSELEQTEPQPTNDKQPSQSVSAPSLKSQKNKSRQLPKVKVTWQHEEQQLHGEIDFSELAEDDGFANVRLVESQQIQVVKMSALTIVAIEV